MKEFIVFLRGINVGGHKKILMKDLKQLLEENQFLDVATYIQSGNIYLKSNLSSLEIKNHIQKIILDHFGFEVLAFVFTQDALKEILEKSPYENQEGDLYFMFVENQINDEDWSRLSSLNTSSDEITQINNCVYLLCKNGYGNTKFSNPYIEKILKANATTRNFNTVQKMVLMFS